MKKTLWVEYERASASVVFFASKTTNEEEGDVDVDAWTYMGGLLPPLDGTRIPVTVEIRRGK